jgi:hypothetical protein
MKKAFVKYGLLGAAAACGLGLMLVIALVRPASAQQNNGNLVGVISEPLILTDEIHSASVLTYAWAQRTNPGPSETTLVLYITSMGPAGPRTVTRSVTLRNTILDGKVERKSLRWGNAADGYIVRAANDQYVTTLEGPPPGEPVIDTVLMTYTTWENLGNGAIYGGSTQTCDSTGKTVTHGKSHELTGNVILMK